MTAWVKAYVSVSPDGSRMRALTASSRAVEALLLVEAGHPGGHVEPEHALEGGGHAEQTAGGLREAGQAPGDDVPGGDRKGHVAQRRRRRPAPVRSPVDLALLEEVAGELEDEEGIAPRLPGPGRTDAGFDLLVAEGGEEGEDLVHVEAFDAHVLVARLPGPGGKGVGQGMGAVKSMFG